MANDAPSTSRRRLNIPAGDVSTLEWIDAQENSSLSIRMLIHQQIERDGMIDVFMRPVKQLPRRGRPPSSEQEPREDSAVETPSSSQEASQAVSVPKKKSKKAETPSVAAPAPEPDADVQTIDEMDLSQI